ncbi:MAG: hypothetical protein EBV91_06260, partial [Actinobacteria bacterium]|nr:hypothetical protein [Actinomycetota bacterium]
MIVEQNEQRNWSRLAIMILPPHSHRAMFLHFAQRKELLKFFSATETRTDPFFIADLMTGRYCAGAA